MAQVQLVVMPQPDAAKGLDSFFTTAPFMRSMSKPHTTTSHTSKAIETGDHVNVEHFGTPEPQCL